MSDAVALRNPPVARAGGSRLRGLCPRCSHRHRWRHRVYLFQGLRLRYRRPGEGRAPPGLARQHLLDDDVVGPLQHRTDLGWDRRVGRQDRV